ncbi:hypothetical protein GQ53DRAFT_685973 [Thozetella sp. PMI_491]|nr:hypothetical protein GQ53DRAFT_685973 [Thozetella sp. PMI_491]
MRQRIDHLEELVKKLITERPQGTSPPGVAAHTPESPTPDSGLGVSDASVEGDYVPSTGRIVMDGAHSAYFGGNDWYAVLQQINELKKAWRQEEDDAMDSDIPPTLSHAVDGSSLLFNQVKPIERMEILSTLPPKHEVDRLIAQFFNTKTFPIRSPPILHEPTFMREYNEHWKEPAQANLIWLGLLFSILGIVMLSYYQYGEPPEYEGISESLFHLYRMRTAQCLLSGDMSKCLPYTVETLRFNATAELNRKDDNRRGLWIMTGVIVRAAINMGYHRDPSHSPNISALQGEYRRRVWVSIISMDDLSSCLGGFPRMMSAMYSDTQEPRNLHDWELSEETKVLPPSRPLSENTNVTYLIAKGRLTRALGRMADFMCAPSLCSYKTVLEIDQAVYDAYHNFPEHLRLPTARINPNPDLGSSSFANLSLFGIYHRSMCTLHRQFLARDRGDDRFKHSRDRCISSAMSLVGFQKLLEPAFYKLWQTRQMLCLAGMVLLLELELRRQAPDLLVSPDSDVLLEALENSCAIWESVAEVSDEVGRTHQVLAGMLADFKADAGIRTEPLQILSPEAQPGLPAPSLGSDTANGSWWYDKQFSNMDFNWATWDAFIEGDGQESGPMY